ncbi:MAG TPA: hypothetical protein DCY55_05690 [Gammaproteobacteria bacterium]|jgi:hypothetical protein|nr:hypothetical protein [Pseudomonadota bacterium]HAY45759.1 hypothetical protein [Gammaproteobacteria bacterium]
MELPKQAFYQHFSFDASRRVQLLIILLLTSLSVSAHHSRSEYSGNPTSEIEGAVVNISWRNPHVMITVKSVEADGSETLWELEGSDAGTFKRRGLEESQIKVGDNIKAAGRISSRRGTWIAMSNILLPNGIEMVFGQGEPRWAEEYVGGKLFREPVNQNDKDAVEGIFRLWIRSVGTTYGVQDEPPLTPEARAAYESYDQLIDDPVLDCTLPGMPRVMTVVGYRPIEFEQDGDDILLHSENFNLTRHIHMNDETDVSSMEATPLGYSTGVWDGDALVVTTTRVSWPFFDLPPLIAIPQSEETKIVERFVLDDINDTLTYDFWAHDPVNFTAPIEKPGYMVWGYQPGQERETDGCVDYVDVPAI